MADVREKGVRLLQSDGRYGRKIDAALIIEATREISVEFKFEHGTRGARYLRPVSGTGPDGLTCLNVIFVAAGSIRLSCSTFEGHWALWGPKSATFLRVKLRFLLGA
jgi:hypothetical protein